MSRRVFFRDSEAQGFTTYGLLLDTLFRQLKTVGISGYFPYEYREDMSCDYAELVSFFGEGFGRLAEQEADASNLSILSKHVSLRGILLERYRKDNERYLAARNSLSIGRLKKVEDKNEPSWAELVASAENEDKRESEEVAKESKDSEGAEGAGIRDSDKGQQNSAAMNSFLAAIKGAHAVDDSVAPEYVEEDDEEPVSGYSSEEGWDVDEDPSVLPADEDEEEGEEDSEEDEGYDVLPADDDEEEDSSVLPDDDEGYSSELPEDEDEEEYSSELPADEDEEEYSSELPEDEDEEEYSSELPADEDEEEYSSELPADEDEEDSSVLPEDDDEDDEEYSSKLPADEDESDEAGYSSELPADDDEEDSSTLPDDEDDEEYSSELPADDDDEEYSSELPADEDTDEDSGYSSELPEDDDDDYSSELPEDDDEDYSSELPADDDDDEDYSSELPDDEDSGVLPDDDDEPTPFKPSPQSKSYTSPMMSYSAPVSSMVVRPSYARGIPGRETQEAVLDMMNKLANNIKGWFSRL